MIFEAAARSRCTACTLCVVSKAVFEWITPILYRTVVFRDQLTANLFNAGSPTRDTRHHHLAAQMRNVFFARHVNAGAFDLAGCSGLQNLVADPTLLHFIVPPMMPALTHLTLYRRGRDRFLDLPLSTTITHLYLPRAHRAASILTDFTTSNLPNLTHLVCSVLTVMEPWNKESALIFLTLIQEFKKLRVVGLQPFDENRCPGHVTDLPAFLHQLGHHGHPGLVFIPAKKFSVNDWENWVSGGESVWETAERTLLAQRWSLHPR